MNQYQYQFPDGIRSIAQGDDVAVYRNLQRRDAFSVQSLTKGKHYRKVVNYAVSLTLSSNVQFKLSHTSRERVLQQRQKNVHAKLVGQLNQIQQCIQPVSSLFVPLSYHPYRSKYLLVLGTPYAVNPDAIFSVAHVQSDRIFVLKHELSRYLINI